MSLGGPLLVKLDGDRGAQTMLVHEWRKFPFLDPDLPVDLLPGKWPRQRAREVFRERHDAWGQMAQDYFRSLDALLQAA